MRVTARLAYGLRALVELVGADGPVKGDVIARRHDLPVGFLEVVLGELRRGGLVDSKRGGRGGYWLARSADAITVADVIRVLEGESANPPPVVDDLAPVWEAISASYMEAAERITLASLAAEAQKLAGSRREKLS
jgi:Rrf2 family protein